MRPRDSLRKERGAIYSTIRRRDDDSRKNRPRDRRAPANAHVLTVSSVSRKTGTHDKRFSSFARSSRYRVRRIASRSFVPKILTRGKIKFQRDPKSYFGMDYVWIIRLLFLSRFFETGSPYTNRSADRDEKSDALQGVLRARNNFIQKYNIGHINSIPLIIECF